MASISFSFFLVLPTLLSLCFPSLLFRWRPSTLPVLRSLYSLHILYSLTTRLSTIVFVFFCVFKIPFRANYSLSERWDKTDATRGFKRLWQCIAQLLAKVQTKKKKTAASKTRARQQPKAPSSITKYLPKRGNRTSKWKSTRRTGTSTSPCARLFTDRQRFESALHEMEGIVG